MFINLLINIFNVSRINNDPFIAKNANKLCNGTFLTKSRPSLYISPNQTIGNGFSLSIVSLLVK